MLKRFVVTAALALGLSACATGGGREDYARFLDGDRDGKEKVSTFFGNYLAARHAVTSRDNEAAAAYYREVLRTDPENQLLLERAFLLGVTSGEYKEARPFADRIVAVRPSNRIARMVIAIDEMERGRFASARAEMEKSAKGLYNGLAIDLITAWSYAGEGDLIAAEQALENASGLALDPVLKSFHLGLIHQFSGDLAKAEENFLRAVEAGGNASPRVADAYGRLLERQGRWTEAIELYRDLLVMVPGQPIIEASIERAESKKRPSPLIASIAGGTAESLYSVASMLTLEHTIDLAVIYLQLARHLDDEFYQADMLLGELFQQRGQLEDAIRVFARIPKSHALAPDAGILIAMNFDRLNMPESAVRVLNDLIRANPEDLNLLIALGELLRSRESYEEAIAVFDQAVSIQAQGEENWFLRYARGAALERVGRLEESDADLLTALDLAPEQPLVLNYLGYSWIERGHRVSDALALVRKAVDLAPNNGFIVDSLGWAYYQLEDYERAVHHLERAVELEPADPMLHDHLGDAYWQAGRFIEAEFEWRHALDLDPSESLAETIQNKLNERVNHAATKQEPN